MDKWQKGNAPASLPIAVGIGMAVLTLAAILVFIWINIYKIILDSEKFTIVYGIFPRRKIMHKELENITVEKREKLGDKAVVLCFYVGGKRRVRFISSDVDYDKAKELLDNLKAINSI